MVSNLLEVNERIISEYFKNLDVQVYYGQNNVAQPVEYLRSIYTEIKKNDSLMQEQEVTEDEQTPVNE